MICHTAGNTGKESYIGESVIRGAIYHIMCISCQNDSLKFVRIRILFSSLLPIRVHPHKIVAADEI